MITSPLIRDEFVANELRRHPLRPVFSTPCIPLSGCVHEKHVLVGRYETVRTVQYVGECESSRSTKWVWSWFAWFWNGSVTVWQGSAPMRRTGNDDVSTYRWSDIILNPDKNTSHCVKFQWLRDSLMSRNHLPLAISWIRELLAYTIAYHTHTHTDRLTPKRTHACEHRYTHAREHKYIHIHILIKREREAIRITIAWRLSLSLQNANCKKTVSEARTDNCVWQSESSIVSSGYTFCIYKCSITDIEHPFPINIENREKYIYKDKVEKCFRVARFVRRNKLL